MKKLKLEVESLAVQSFATDGGNGRRGTVQGHWSYPVYATCDTWDAACGTGGSNCQCIPSQWGWECGGGGCSTDWQTCANTCNTCDQATCISCDTCQITGPCEC